MTPNSQLSVESLSDEYIKATFKCMEKLLRAKRAYKDLIIQTGFVETSTLLLNRSQELDRLICTTVRLVVGGSEAGCKAGFLFCLRTIKSSSRVLEFSLVFSILNTDPLY